MPINVAIVGRPNVGKSTLFNRLVGKRTALVDDAPGLIRDRREGQARLAGAVFTVIDTAGMQEADAGTLAGDMLLIVFRRMKLGREIGPTSIMRGVVYALPARQEYRCSKV